MRVGCRPRVRGGHYSATQQLYIQQYAAWGKPVRRCQGSTPSDCPTDRGLQCCQKGVLSEPTAPIDSQRGNCTGSGRGDEGGGGARHLGYSGDKCEADSGCRFSGGAEDCRTLFILQVAALRLRAQLLRPGAVSRVRVFARSWKSIFLPAEEQNALILIVLVICPKGIIV